MNRNMSLFKPVIWLQQSFERRKTDDKKTRFEQGVFSRRYQFLNGLTFQYFYINSRNPYSQLKNTKSKEYKEADKNMTAFYQSKYQPIRIIFFFNFFLLFQQRFANFTKKIWVIYFLDRKLVLTYVQMCPAFNIYIYIKLSIQLVFL